MAAPRHLRTERESRSSDLLSVGQCPAGGHLSRARGGNSPSWLAAEVAGLSFLPCVTHTGVLGPVVGAGFKCSKLGRG